MPVFRSTLIAVALAVVGAAGCGKNEGGASAKAAATKATVAARPVEVAMPRVAPFARNLTLSGSLEAKDRVDIAARVEGPVTAVLVDLGTRVAKNAILARIEPADFAARHEVAEAQLALAEGDLDRSNKLASTQMATPQTLEAAKTRAAVARSELALAARQLRDTSVRAPFAGGISRRDVSVGAYVRVGSPLFELVSYDDLRLVVEVPEEYLGLVQLDETVRLSVKGKPIDAKIVRISPKVSADKRSYTVEADVPASKEAVPGTFVTAVLDVGVEPNAARLPRSAVFSVLGRNRVLVVVNGQAESRDVELIGEEAGQAVVVGVKADEQVIVRGPQTIAPGTKVQIETRGTSIESAQKATSTRPG